MSTTETTKYARLVLYDEYGKVETEATIPLAPGSTTAFLLYKETGVAKPISKIMISIPRDENKNE